MTATFILSFDCEGKWGMADRLTSEIDRSITDESNTYVYEAILQTLQRHEIAATFAVVGLFVTGPDGVNQFRNQLSESPAHDLWMRAPLRALDSNSIGGWYKTDLLERLKIASHEVASHSLTHVPFDGANVDTETRSLELALMQEVGTQQGISFDTFVYPRNLIVEPDLLTDVGILGYRTNRDFRGHPKLARLESFASEFNIFQRSEAQSLCERPVAIPSGVFLNWRHGLRRSVPIHVSVARWKHVLDHAERTNGVAHLWLHPHNLLTAPTCLRLLDLLLDLVSERQKSGRLVVRTQAEYSAILLGIRTTPDMPSVADDV